MTKIEIDAYQNYFDNKVSEIKELINRWKSENGNTLKPYQIQTIKNAQKQHDIFNALLVVIKKQRQELIEGFSDYDLLSNPHYSKFKEKEFDFRDTILEQMLYDYEKYKSDKNSIIPIGNEMILLYCLTTEIKKYKEIKNAS